MGTKTHTTHTVFFEGKRVAAGEKCSIESTRVSVLLHNITSGVKVNFSDPQYQKAYIY